MLLPASLLVTAVACTSPASDPPLARYRRVELHTKDLPDSLATGVRPQAERWLRDQVLAQAALDSLPQVAAEIEPIVQRYRLQLLRQRLRTHLVQQMDHTVSAEELESYYHSFRQSFRAGAPYVQYRLVRVPAPRVPLGLLARLPLATADDLNDWRLRCVDQDSLACRAETAWVDQATLARMDLPDNLLRESASVPLGTPVSATQRIGSVDFHVAFVVLARISPADPLPLELAAPAVQAAILAQRTNLYLQAYENRLLQQAFANRDAQLLLPASPRP